MDKPQSLSVKDFLIRTLAVKLMVPEKTIEAVVSHQFSEANIALKTNDSIEISGFGKFFFNYKKAVKKMEKMLSQKAMFEKILTFPDITEQKRHSTNVKLTNVINNINVLKPKLYGPEFLTDSGGMEEQVDSPSSFERVD
jgi:nucleoid DNA-binding protein